MSPLLLGKLKTESQKQIASYCTTFLKAEMLHLYRQVTHLKRFKTYVLTRKRENSGRYPFEDVELLHKPPKNFLRRFYLKHIRGAPPIIYRGEFQNLQKVLKRRPVELMHIYFGHTGVHLLPFIEAWSRPCVVSFHGADVMPREEEPQYLDRLKRMLRIAPRVLARSDSLKERLIALGCPSDRIGLNRTGIPLDLFPFTDRQGKSDAPVLVQACRLIPKKGLPTTLRAFLQVRERYPEARLIIAGEGPMLGELQTMVGDLELAGAVEFPGFLDQAALCELYKSADIFVHPSQLTADQNQEGVPNSMLEAMATGLPVAATRHGGIPEAVEDGKSGWLVDEEDHEALASALLALLADPGQRLEFGQAGAAQVREKFELHRQIELLEEQYAQVIEEWPQRDASRRAGERI